jgi:hypothetical protein
MAIEDSTFLERLGIYFLVFILISLLFEVGLFVYAFFHADEVRCNLLWCEFISERTTIESTISQECFVNGERVNCSDFPGDEHFCDGDNCSMNGVEDFEEWIKGMR